MIVHQVKIGEQKPDKRLPLKNRIIYVTSAVTDLKYRDMLVYFRHRWEFYIHGSLEFTTCDRTDSGIDHWKQTAERKICESDGVLMLVSENTVKDIHAVWEIDTALAHHVPIVGVDIRNRFEGDIPAGLVGRMTRYGWEWFAQFINSI